MRLLTATTALALLASTGLTQTQITTAGERMAQEFAPMGVRAGSFLVIPKADVELEYNDNIYATTNNTESDMITTVRPEVAVRSNWNRHALNALARAEINRFADNDREDTENFLVGVDGRADVMRDTSIAAGVGFQRNHEERGNPNTPATATKPTEVDTLIARAGVRRELGRMNARFDTEARNVDHKNGSTSAGAVINNNLRDRNEYTQALRLGYRVNDQFEGFVRGTVDTRAYDRKGGGGVVNRSSNGKSLVAGTAFDISGKSKGEVFAGVMERNYSDSALEDISEPTWGGKVTWNPTQLTSLIGRVDRTVEETTLANSSAFVATTYGVDAEHALTRSMLLKAGVALANNEYQGRTGTQREDDVLTVGAGVDYHLNRMLKAGVGYTYRDRDSNAVNGDFSRNTLLLRLTGTY